MSASHSQPQTTQPARSYFAFAATAIALASFGITMLALSAAYTQDLAVLASAPFAIWSALCGQPSDNPTALSILIILSVLSLLIGLVLGAVAIVRSHR